MIDFIEKCIQEKNYEQSIKICNENSLNSLSKLLSTVLGISQGKKFVCAMLLCNWCSSEDLCKSWNRFSKNGNMEWENLKVIPYKEDEVPDFYIVINQPPNNTKIDKKKTIVFQMEPEMDKRFYLWGAWANPKDDEFFKVFRHTDDVNNLEWHISWSYTDLISKPIEKTCDILSTVLSDKYSDIGHVKRIDFVKFLESKNFPVHVYGNNKYNYKSYKGPLPPNCKDDALIPYKYTFNIENTFCKNYVTEKLVDAIVSETLCFYFGCVNIKEIFDEQAFVLLDINNFEKSYDTILSSIKNDEWSKRIEYIRKEKHKILNKLSFFPRVCKLVNKNLD